MNSELKKYAFKTDISSVYQIFWVTYDILNISPNTDLDFNTQGAVTIMSITNTNLSYSGILLIFNKNNIEYENVLNKSREIG
ncbi:MAG: hypothetical protein ABJ218_03285 [Winogradskyella arenosi]